MKREIRDSLLFDVFPVLKSWMVIFQRKCYGWGQICGVFIGIFVGSVISELYDVTGEIVYGYLTVLGLVGLIGAIIVSVISSSIVKRLGMIGMKAVGDLEKVIRDDDSKIA